MYDTIKELHIEIEQRVQQVTSNRYGAMPPEFYDMVLNRTAVQYVQIKSNRKTNYKAEGLEDSKKRVDDIASLKRETTWLPTMKCPDEPNRAFIILPGDYLKLITSTSRLKFGKKDYNPDIHKVSTGDNIKNIYYHVLNLKQIADEKMITNTNVPISIHIGFTNIDGVKTGGTKIDITDIYNLVYSNGSQPYDLSEISSLLCDRLRDELDATYQVYWEHFIGRNYNKCIVITNNKPEAFALSVGENDPIHSLSNNVPNTTYDTFDISSIKNEYKYSPNDLIATENIYSILNNFYSNRNRHLNPITTAIDDRLYVYYGNDFCVDAIKVSYIKTPKTFNYHLNQMSDLTITPEFMDLVVSNILIILKDDSANTVRQQFNLE